MRKAILSTARRLQSSESAAVASRLSPTSPSLSRSCTAGFDHQHGSRPASRSGSLDPVARTSHVRYLLCYARLLTARRHANVLLTDTEAQKEEFRQNPKKLLQYCKGIENELNQRFKFILKGTPEAAAAKEYATQEMSTKLAGNQELIDAIIPKNFGVGCRRPTVSASPNLNPWEKNGRKR